MKALRSSPFLSAAWVLQALIFSCRRLGAGHVRRAEGQGQVVAAIRDNSLFIRVSFSSGWVDKTTGRHLGTPAVLLQRVHPKRMTNPAETVAKVAWPAP
jgi:hypothetical protein